MSRLAYLDCVGGLAGDMLLGALLDAGGRIECLREIPALLGLEDVEIAAERVERHGIAAIKVDVVGNDREHDRGHRRYGELRSAVEHSALGPSLRVRTLSVLDRLARAEAGVHGVSVDEVHLHELSSADTLVDVCGSLALLDDLEVEEVACSPLPFARGLINSAHGRLPAPAPATLALLHGAPLADADGEGELVTPTGAAVAATVAEGWGGLPPLVLEAVGYGAGARQTPERPNILRVVLGRSEGADTADVALVETNLDDLNPELIPDAAGELFTAGALDVWTTPVHMKKGRPGIVLSALGRPEREKALALAMLEQTSALGVRVSRVRRYELEREERTIEVLGGRVRVKIGRLGGRVVNVAPEHDDCLAIADLTGRTVKAVWAAAFAAAQS